MYLLYFKIVMAEIVTKPQFKNSFSLLGTQQGDLYIVDKRCLSHLEEIFENLILEDRTLRTYRRAIGFGENIRKDLIPLLINVRSCIAVDEATKIIDAIVKILLNLTAPVECLLSLEHESQTDVGRHTIFELNRLLITSKAAFTNNRSTKAVVDHIKYIAEQASNLNNEQCESIHNCLLLLRNVLHIPENPFYYSSTSPTSMQNYIVWNLFSQSMDKMLIYLITCPQKVYWVSTMVQLIASLYKDLHVDTLQKLLCLWFDTSLSESSEDNESNTSPQSGRSGESSPVVTSDPTSDSSDNSSKHTGPLKMTLERHKNNTCLFAVETISVSHKSSNANAARKYSIDSGVCLEPVLKNMKRYVPIQISGSKYDVTQLHSKGETVSTSSNDDDQIPEKPIHHFARLGLMRSHNVSLLEKKELKRKKLVKRSKANIINMKAVLHHIPTDEDVADVLKEFTVDLLLKAFSILVQDLYTYLVTNVNVSMDISHFLWLVTYFLKFATQLELDLEFINPVLSYNVVSYLVFQGISLFENFQISCRMSHNVKPCFRRLHLVVTAIREFIQSLQKYDETKHLSNSDHARLLILQRQMIELEELRNFFLLLLRHYNFDHHSNAYLEDIIVTNHHYLLLLDKMSKTEGVKVKIKDHLKEFATIECMRLYGILLENFQGNRNHVNDCIFTMMHHTAGDLENMATLFQPAILRTFSEMWETDFKLCDDWSDLIEFVIHNFMNVSKYDSALNTAENCSTYGLACHFSGTNEMENGLCEQYSQHISISHTTKSFFSTASSAAHSNYIEYEIFSNEVNLLKGYFIKDGKQKYLLWLQKSVLEARLCKLIVTHERSMEYQSQILQPVTYYNTVLNLPIPLVPWTLEQTNIIKYQPFVSLLLHFGFILPGDTDNIFIKIPNFWTSKDMLDIAEQLGPIDYVSPTKINEVKISHRI
ncbi:protein timeless-like isoform X2 [Photinus pyralis]|uniref:Timeless N-terminal domain-containing protein n=2 Tax=Photinus pyralis TaxID=7054 RepID=A0A1Y1LIM5_PHOPY|nr:protein timeless-like isoform X2 [Photinus pyralis]XP_031344537.1 protein timeless-like isoform X2 [Photinus pyralis]